MFSFVPRYMFLTKGVGVAKQELASFEMALRNAGIAPYNLVSVSSIFPPGCKIISRTKGIKMLKPGQIVFCVLSRTSSNEPNRLISAGVGLALPKDETKYGYLSEYHGYGITMEKAKREAEDLAATMLASTLGIKFNADESYDKRKKVYMLSGQIVKATSIVQTAKVNKDGLYTTVVAAAVFVP